MKWPRWIPRLHLEAVPEPDEARHHTRITTPVGERSGIRDVGQCEVCGRPMQARTRHEEFRGRVDCDCGFRNHVEFRDVRVDGAVERRYATVSSGRRFESATHRPNLRLAWRSAICASCNTAVKLADARSLAHEDADGMTETISYFCPACHTHDDVRRGRLLGHDGTPVMDILRYQAPPDARHA